MILIRKIRDICQWVTRKSLLARRVTNEQLLYYSIRCVRTGRLMEVGRNKASPREAYIEMAEHITYLYELNEYLEPAQYDNQKLKWYISQYGFQLVESPVLLDY